MSDKSKSRWRFPNQRYTESVSSLLRFVFAEPSGYHQGARLSHGEYGTKSFRSFVIKEKNKAKAKLQSLL